MKNLIFMFIFCVASDAAEDGLLHHWRFGEAKGGKIPAKRGAPANFSGEAQAEKDDDLDWLRLKGTNSRAWVADNFRTTQFPAKAITVEAWVSPARAMKWGGIAGIIQDNGSYERGWLLGYVDRKFSFALASEGHRQLPYMQGTTAFLGNHWYHVVGTYDSDTNATRLYVNGKLEAEQKVHSGAIFYPPNAPFELGGYKDDNEFYRGAIRLHEISIYERALDASVIAKRFAARKEAFPLPPPPPEALEFVSHPQLRWERRDALRVQWTTSQARRTFIQWKRSKDKEVRLIDLGVTREVSAVIDSLPPEGEFIYRIVAKGEGKSEFVSPWYKFDTSFHYRLPPKPQRPSPFGNDTAMRRSELAAKHILAKSGLQQGYALVLGSAGGRLAYELARQTDLQVVVVEPDPAKAQAARKALNVAGLYGVRASVHVGDLARLPYGPYFANLIVSGSLLVDGELPGESAEELMRMLRPAGGMAILGRDTGQLAAAEMRAWFKRGGVDCKVYNEDGLAWATVTRAKLDGSGDWTHQYGSADNTTNSRDDLVRGEMGILWWGEPGPRPMPDRGGRNPAPLAANGRMFVQGDRVLFGMDAYNGTVLWTFFSPEMRRSNIPRDGSNMVATDDALYVTIGGECVALDAQTGRRLNSVLASKGRDWGWISASKDQLITASVKRGASHKADDGEWYEKFVVGEVDRVVSDSVASHNPSTGKAQWVYRGGAVMNSTLTLADGVVYFVESRNPEVIKTGKSRVMPALLTQQHMVALDQKSGRKLWEKPVDFSKCENMIYLVHAEGTLVVTGSSQKKDKVPSKYYTYVYDVSSPALQFSGKPILNANIPLLWEASQVAGKRFNADVIEDHHGGLVQHPLVVKDVLYTDNRAFNLRTGDGKPLPITFPKRRGCGNMAASNHSMFYRHHYHSIWDLETKKDFTFEGIRSGCWMGIIPAQGLMLAPESSSGCGCAHNSIQTSAAWVPRTALKKPKDK